MVLEMCRTSGCANTALSEAIVMALGGKLVPKTAAHRPAVDRRDHRLTEPPNLRPMVDAAAVLTLPILDVFGMRFALRVQ